MNDFATQDLTTKDLEVVGTRGFYHPTGRASFEAGVAMIAAAMKQARALGLMDLVVNIHGLTGFEPLEIFRRYEMATRWVESAGAAVRVAWVLRPDLIDRQKIGVVIAQNRGADGDVFGDEAEALAWLDARGASDRARRSPADHSNAG
jgi:hypothetical protein